MILTDTHCHIHDPEFFTSEEAEAAYLDARESDVRAMLLVGTSLESSRAAVEFASQHEGCYAALGIHPHEASKLTSQDIRLHTEQLSQLVSDKTVSSIGECGFDFYYNDRDQHLKTQTILLESQLQIAQDSGLPMSFHVREAFDDFWPVFDNFSGLNGVLHSFTDKKQHVDKALQRGLYIGINGIATFTSHVWQREIFRTLPLEKILIETDAPFLTPIPRRGTINTPKNVIYITNFLAELRGENADTIATATTRNARSVFGFF